MNNPRPRIPPTVGRIVHFHLGGTEPIPDPGRSNFRLADNDLYAATIAAVVTPTLVNLTVSDSWGNTFGRTNIPLVQEGEEHPAGAWCEWMDYQKGQAAKTEQLERQLAGDRVPTLNTPHPAVAATQPLGDDGNAFNKTYDENVARRGQYEEQPAPTIPQD